MTPNSPYPPTMRVEALYSIAYAEIASGYQDQIPRGPWSSAGLAFLLLLSRGTSKKFPRHRKSTHRTCCCFCRTAHQSRFRDTDRSQPDRPISEHLISGMKRPIRPSETHRSCIEHVVVFVARHVREASKTKNRTHSKSKCHGHLLASLRP